MIIVSKKLIGPLVLCIAASACGSALQAQGVATGPLSSAYLLLVPPSNLDVPPQIVLLPEGTETSNLDIDLAPGALVTGTLTTAGGAGLIAAQVQAVGTGVGGSRIVIIDTTDHNGAYSLLLPPGRFRITVTPDGDTPPFLATANEPNGLLEVAASPVELNAAAPEPVQLAGTVSVAGVSVRAFNSATGAVSTAGVVSGNGSFSLYVSEPGTYTLELTPPAELGEELPVVEVSGVTIPSTNFSYGYPPGFPVDPSTRLLGTITPEDPNGATPAFDAMIVRATSAFTVSGRATESFTFTTETTVDENGAFAATLIPGEDHELTILPGLLDDYGYRTQTVSIDGDTFLPGEQTTLPNRVLVGGTITDASGRGLAGSIARYRTLDGSQYLFTKLSDATGHYTLAVPPATYAVEHIPPSDSGLVRMVEEQSLGEDSVSSFALPQGQLLSGTVWLDGTAVEGAQITALDKDNDEEVGSREALTDVNGLYFITVPIVTD